MRHILHNKRGVEIAINYIVMMVLGLATLALGFVIVKAFVVGGDQSITLTSDQLNAKVATLLCSETDVICFSNNNQRIHRSEYAFIGLNIKNIYGQPVTLTISLDSGKYFDADGNQGAVGTAVKSVLGADQLTIAAKDDGKIGIGLYAEKDAPKGTYSFLVTVEDPSGVFKTRKDKISIQVI